LSAGADREGARRLDRPGGGRGRLVEQARLPGRARAGPEAPGARSGDARAGAAAGSGSWAHAGAGRERPPPRLDLTLARSPADTGLVNVAYAAAVFAPALAVGSFLNVVASRLPLGRSVSKPRSACMQCGTAIRPRDNV